MKRIIIIGAASMIGVALIKEALQYENNFIYAVCRKNSENISRIPQSGQVEIIECDLSELEVLPQKIVETCDAIYFLAWEQSKQDRNDNISIQCQNIEYTLDSVRIAQILGCDKFIGVGSQAEYGPINDNIITSDTGENPTTPYGICKYTAGRLSKCLCDRLRLEHIWVRVFSVYGKNDHQQTMIMQTINNLKNDERMPLTSGEQIWNYLFEEDAGRGLYSLLENGTSGKTYNLAGSSNRPLKEYMKIIGQKLGREDLLGINDIECSEQNAPNMNVDMSEFERDTGFAPSVSFEEGIDKILKDSE